MIWSSSCYGQHGPLPAWFLEQICIELGRSVLTQEGRSDQGKEPRFGMCCSNHPLLDVNHLSPDSSLSHSAHSTPFHTFPASFQPLRLGLLYRGSLADCRCRDCSGLPTNALIELAWRGCFPKVSSSSTMLVMPALTGDRIGQYVQSAKQKDGSCYPYVHIGAAGWKPQLETWK